MQIPEQFYGRRLIKSFHLFRNVMFVVKKRIFIHTLLFWSVTVMSVHKPMLILLMILRIW